MLSVGGIRLKKDLLVTAVIAGTALLATELVKRLSAKKAVEESVGNQYSIDECENAENMPKVKKTKNHNENIVRVNNSLISIKIKLFSK